jgi:hypothetical protein
LNCGEKYRMLEEQGVNEDAVKGGDRMLMDFLPVTEDQGVIEDADKGGDYSGWRMMADQGVNEDAEDAVKGGELSGTRHKLHFFRTMEADTNTI